MTGHSGRVTGGRGRSLGGRWRAGCLGDLFETAFVVADDQIGGDEIARRKLFDFLGVGNRVGHGHGRHQAGNCAVHDGYELARSIDGNDFGLKRVVLFREQIGMRK